MANYEDQARAIWSALDTMVQQDPEGYKKFVKEQMEEARKMVQQKTEKKDDSGEGSGLEKPFGKMGLGGTGSPAAERKPPKKDKKVKKTTNLLDDEITGTGSILAQIVKKPLLGDDEEDEVKLHGLEVSSGKIHPPTHKMKAQKPLIEEI